MCQEELRFDGVYRTTTPIPLNSRDAFGETFSLSLRFRPGFTVECEYLLDEGTEYEVGGASTTTFKSRSGAAIRFSFPAEFWDTEWEGTARGEELRLTYLLEVVSPGPAAFTKCVVEGETTLVFAQANAPPQASREFSEGSESP